MRNRKGVPDELRGIVWPLVSGGRELLLRNPGVYERLMLFESSASELDIVRDLNRTFPGHVYYAQRHGPGQRSLYNVLKAYSVFDRSVGYVQGMGFVTGTFVVRRERERERLALQRQGVVGFCRTEPDAPSTLPSKIASPHHLLLLLSSSQAFSCFTCARRTPSGPLWRY